MAIGLSKFSDPVKVLGPVFIVLGVALVLVAERSGVITVAIVQATFALVLFSVRAEKLLALYLCYLMLEGALKIWSNYTPVSQVSSDIVLILAFLRLVHARAATLTPFRPAPEITAKLNSIVNFLVLFWIWVLIQFLNPWGLGLLPSLAALKIYVVPVLVFFIVGYFLPDEEVERLLGLIVVLAVLQSFLGLWDWRMGEGFLPAMHPRYQSAMVNIRGYPYRPFGTTAVPGGPGVWVFHSVAAVLLLLSLDKLRKEKRRSRSTARALVDLSLLVYPAMCIALLLVCQVRVIIVRYVLTGLLGLCLLGRRYVVSAGLCLAIPAMLGSVVFSTQEISTVVTNAAVSNTEIGKILARARTLQNLETYSTARGGGFSVKELLNRAAFTIAGAGLSRLGASSIPWGERIQADPFFSKGWGGADSLFIAIFSEVGLGGLVVYLLLMLTLMGSLLVSKGIAPKIALVYCLVMLGSGYATEGILYQPDAAFFWLYAGFGLRMVAGGKEEAK